MKLISSFRLGPVHRWGVIATVIAVASLAFVVDAHGTLRQTQSQLVAAQTALASDVSDPIGVVPQVACSSLRSPTGSNPLPGGTDLSQLAEAPTRILTANVVPASGSRPEYCDVIGYIEPQIQFELRLPTTTWNGRYLQTGCGGFCGVVGIDKCNDVLGLNFAVAAENSGHFGSEGLWGRNNDQLRIDFGYRAAHAMAVSAKKITEIFYGQKPDHSYWRGCSMGGREGFMEMQRYPADFDGVLAGDPAFQVLQGSIANEWLAQKGRRPDGSIILQAGATLNDLHQKVLDACDGLDGLVDGLIDDPRNCNFDPTTAGLTPEQLRAVQEFVAGPHKSNGQRVYPGWVFWGSELNWQDAVTISTYYANEALRFLVFKNSPPLSYDYQDFNFDTDVPKLKWALDLNDAINADLTAFHQRGGKLIMYHGYADSTVSPMTSINFYQGIADANGGRAAIQDWARLFMVPGMFHCGGGQQPVRLGVGGDSPVGADPVIQLVDWVENANAPDKLVASYLTGGVVTRTRPVYPYPTVARYSGSGSIDDAASFVPAPPPAAHNDKVNWIWDDFKLANVK